MRGQNFGFNPEDNENHFVVDVQDKTGFHDWVTVYERFHYDEDDEKYTYLDDVAKVEISANKWNRIAPTVTREFNRRLKEVEEPQGKFGTGQTLIEKRMGKELLVLLWAIENAVDKKIPTALTNWLGLQPEERWWLYTMTNACTGKVNDDGKGWREALYYALCENPI